MEQSSLSKIKEKWNDILSYLKNEYDLSEVSYNTWISPLTPVRLIKNANEAPDLIIEVPDKLFQNYVSKKYTLYINVAIEEITGVKCTPKFMIKDQDVRKENGFDTERKKVDSSTLVIANLNPGYTFGNFVVGKNNNLAHAASLAVAESPGEIYNPLFIYGGVGLGKTHLMQSIAHFILEKNPKSRILYVTSEMFTNELIDSIRNKSNYSTTEFRNKYRNVDVLLIDDIQFIIGKESTQEEFFYTFNDLYEAKKQIIISSDKPPKEFETLEERLRSRFEWGLTVDIQPPDYETRMAILRKKEERDNINIDNEIIQYIATNIKSNIRELEGALTKIVFMSKLDHREININLAQDVLKDMISPDSLPEITPQRIVQVIAEHFHISELDLVGQKRNKQVVFPRQIAMYLCREMTNTSLQEVGNYLGGRDHTTIIHGEEKISTDLKSNTDLQTTIDILKKKISTH